MANEDWEEAVQRIHNAQKIEATNLDLTNLRIDALPEQIADLKDLRHLSAYYTQISDLSPISGLTQLQHLDLDTAPIVDLSEIAGLVNLTRLNLDNTGVNDLAPIAGLTALEELRLESTAVTNLAGVVGLTRLNNVVVGNTSINDISSFINHTRLRSLSLSRTPVADLRPLLKVAFQPLEFGVTFEDTPACQDPVIAAAAEIKDNEERLQALLTHLRTLPPWPEPLDTSRPHRGTTAVASPAIQTAQTQIAFLIEHAAVSRTPASTAADQIRFALRDVPATEGNRLPAVLQTLADVATILDRIGSTVVKPDPKADLTRQIAALERRVEDLVAQLADANAAKDAADALAKSDSFLSHYKQQLAKASANATVGAAAAIIVIGVPTTMHYFLGATNPLVKSLFKAMRMKP